jgi:hypothetical protein
MTKYHKNVAVAGFVALIFVSLIVLYNPGLDSMETIQPAIAVLLVSLYLGGRTVWARPPKLIWLPIIAALVAIPFVILSRAFGSFLVMSLVFHAQFGIEGADFVGFGQEIFDGVLYVCLVLLGAYALSNLLSQQKAFYSLATVVLIVLNPLTWYLVEYGKNQSIESDLHLQLSEAELAPPAVLPDIIYVYLEGLERGFENSNVFGDIYAPLKPYEEMGVTFTGLHEINGTGWSLAGTVATQCGVPLVPTGLRAYKNLDEKANFMPSRACLTDLTARLGYQNSYVMGGSQNFGGFDHFFSAHNFDNIVDMNAVSERRDPDEIEAATISWHLDDEMMLIEARDLYEAKKTQDAPMLMMILTYGPHGTTSGLSRGCSTSGRAELAPDISSAIACTLKDVVPFIDHLIENRRDRPTIVVLGSDHLNHDPGMSETVALSDRRNTLIMFSLGMSDPLVPPGTRIDRPASMVDVFPTILAYAGLASPNVRAGLGRSMFGELPTIMEEKGLSRFDSELFPNPLLSKAIWDTDAE